MKTLLFIIVAFLDIACSNIVDENHIYIQSELKPFYNKFINEAHKRNMSFDNIQVSMILGSIPDGTDGLTKYDVNEIIINSIVYHDNIGHSYNDSTQYYKIELIVLHECGHYFLHRQHTSDSVFSIMNANEDYLYNYQSSASDRQKLIDELFK